MAGKQADAREQRGDGAGETEKGRLPEVISSNLMRAGKSADFS
jgi:hypothetical protein